MMKEEHLQAAMRDLGSAWILAQALSKTVQEFLCKMYTARARIYSVKLRYEIFRLKRGDVEPEQLPPCKDCLYQHCLRANYQAAIWRPSLKQHPVNPSPESHDWTVDCTVPWMNVPPAPEIVLELMAHNCSKSICPNVLLMSITCTSACKLQDCKNMMDKIHQQDVADSSDEESDQE